MKRLLILFVLFCSVLCHAQQQNVKIYLNNGRIVSGGLQEETSTTVTIVKPDGSRRPSIRLRSERLPMPESLTSFP